MFSGVRDLIFPDERASAAQCRRHFSIDGHRAEGCLPLSIGHKGYRLTHPPMIWSEHKEDRGAIDAPKHSPGDGT